jgi:mRNA interferase RelE/StbE
LTKLKNAKTLRGVRSLEKLKGYETYYRLRIGDFRVGIEFVESKVILTRFLHRKDIYKYFP